MVGLGRVELVRVDEIGFGRVRVCRNWPCFAWVGSGFLWVLRFGQKKSGRSSQIFFGLGCIADGQRWSDSV